ncbi:spore coat protein GerQ [Longirhabdus pacifica]|uniref:spore coat protein GerQ n=1 Tax=Longirhabdus pacifica TaxID=2305227 RepID=UPI001F0C3D99|nr:spore coat protein GerQ [Longirhabdus pacifica]
MFRQQQYPMKGNYAAQSMGAGTYPMNYGYGTMPMQSMQQYVSPSFIPGTPSGGAIFPFQAATPPTPATPGQLPLEQSYVENILRLNLGKVATIYMTYENNEKWNAKVFRGELEAAGRDHIIISDRATGKRYLLLMINLDYIEFDERLEYTFPFGSADTTTMTNG